MLWVKTAFRYTMPLYVKQRDDLSLSTFIGFSACKFILRMDRNDCIDLNFNIKLMFTCRWFHIRGQTLTTGAPDWLYNRRLLGQEPLTTAWHILTSNYCKHLENEAPFCSGNAAESIYIYIYIINEWSVLVLHHDYDDTVKVIMTYSKSTRSNLSFIF